MATKVDARGLSCPQPIMLAQQAMRAGDFPIEVWVDSVTSRENVRRIAERKGYNVTIQEQDGEFVLAISK
ncbi:hypothetical protein ADN00_06810 [Ornatilinea apprima]|uniref:UPF0033 domain-containing protein n=1 Tax=Ornatilinea apprima TaxID=1134406 RepID=A0A0P6XTJ4_9CHLR|nr:sulfurtransferase TusA family protein [Ornatilinea apprima]KPL78428.1 hypothetical protein ADN00_06810 [Ornatilinea apprima]